MIRSTASTKEIDRDEWSTSFFTRHTTSIGLSPVPFRTPLRGLLDGGVSPWHSRALVLLDGVLVGSARRPRHDLLRVRARAERGCRPQTPRGHAPCPLLGQVLSGRRQDVRGLHQDRCVLCAARPRTGPPVRSESSRLSCGCGSPLEGVSRALAFPARTLAGVGARGAVIGWRSLARTLREPSGPTSSADLSIAQCTSTT